MTTTLAMNGRVSSKGTGRCHKTGASATMLQHCTRERGLRSLYLPPPPLPHLLNQQPLLLDHLLSRLLQLPPPLLLLLLERNLEEVSTNSGVCLRIFGKLHFFLRASGPRMPRSTLFDAQCLARQWLHVMRHFGSLWTYFALFAREGGNSDPEVDFVLLFGGMEKCAQVILQFHCRGGPTWRSDATFMSRLHLAVTCPRTGRFRRRVFGSARWVTAVSRRGLRAGGGVAGSLDSQVTCHPNQVHAPRCHMDKHMSSATGPHHLPSGTTRV